MNLFDSNINPRLQLYAKLIRLDRPVGIFLLLWPTLWALLIASNGYPRLSVFVVFVVGVILMRSAGCAINDFADRNFDPHVARTKDRPIASKQISPSEGIAVFAVLCFVAFLLVVLFLNRLVLWFSIPTILLAASYPFTKRWHYLPQVHLGAAFAWAVPMAYVAQTNAYPSPTCWLLFMCALIWTTAYDTLYAMADREEDLQLGVKSTAILFGEADRLIVGILQALVVVSLLFIGLQANLSKIYYSSLILVIVLFIYQQVLIAKRDPQQCIKAFQNNQIVGFVIYLGIGLAYWLKI